MDMESESSAVESLKDNGLIQQADHLADDGRIQHNGSCSVETEEPVSAATAEADKNEEAVELDKPLNSNTSGVKSPGGTTPFTKKGYGLKKWRRIKRDHVKDTSANVDNSKVLKRVFSGSANVHSKHMHLPSLPVKQDSLGSIGSVSLQKNIAPADGIVMPGSSLDPMLAAGLAFSAGVDSENSEDWSSRSSTAASAPRVRHDQPMVHSRDKQRTKHFGIKTMANSGQRCQQGKIRVENSKKPIGERVKIEKENSHSSMESDSRSSNFLFMQGAFFSASSRKQSEGLMDYNGENSDEAHTNGETSRGKDNVGEEVEDLSQEDSAADTSVNGNRCSSADLDPLAESINGLLTTQEALEEEILKFREIGKEPAPLHYDADGGVCMQAPSSSTGQRVGGSSSSHWLETKKVGQKGSTLLDSQLLTLQNNVEFLQSKLEETRAVLEVKESRIRDLESTVHLSKSLSEENGSTSESLQEIYGEKEIGLEAAFRQRVEAEIECVILSRSVENLRAVSHDQMKLFEEQKTVAGEQAHQMLSRLGEAQSKAAVLNKQAEELEDHCGDIVEAREAQNIKKKACKATSCFLTQLVLLLFVVWLFISQLLPESEIVVPT